MTHLVPMPQFLKVVRDDLQTPDFEQRVLHYQNEAFKEWQADDEVYILWLTLLSRLYGAENSQRARKSLPLIIHTIDGPRIFEKRPQMFLPAVLANALTYSYFHPPFAFLVGMGVMGHYFLQGYTSEIELWNSPPNLVKILFGSGQDHLYEVQDDSKFAKAAISLNKAEAIEFFQKSAREGSLVAQNYLGYCYLYGEMVGKDIREAMRWYLSAAERDYPPSQEGLGCCLMTKGGEDFEAYSKALEWFRKGAKNGKASCHWRIGSFYEYGKGVERNLSTALEHYEAAAQSGDPYGYYRIGLLLSKYNDKVYNINKAITALAQGILQSDKRQSFSRINRQMLSFALTRRFMWTNKLRDIALAFILSHAASDTKDCDPSELALYHSDRAQTYDALFSITGRLSLLSMEIDDCSTAYNLAIKADETSSGHYLDRYIAALRRRGEYCQEPETFKTLEALNAARLDKQHPSYELGLSTSAYMQSHIYDATGSLHALTDRLELLHKARTASSSLYNKLIFDLQILVGQADLSRHQGLLEMLDETISGLERFNDKTSSTHKFNLLIRGEISSLFYHRYWKTSCASDKIRFATFFPLYYDSISRALSSLDEIDVTYLLFGVSFFIPRNIDAACRLANAYALQILAYIYRLQEDIQSAVCCFTSSLSLYFDTYSVIPSAVPPLMDNLAFSYATLGLFQEAQQWYSSSMEISKRTLGISDFYTASVMCSYAWLLEVMGHTGESSQLFNSAIATMSNQLSDHLPKLPQESYVPLLPLFDSLTNAHWWMVRSPCFHVTSSNLTPLKTSVKLLNLGQAYWLSGRLHSAKTCLMTAEPLYDGSLDRGPGEYLHCLERLTLVHMALLDTQSAMKTALKVVRIREMEPRPAIRMHETGLQLIGPQHFVVMELLTSVYKQGGLLQDADLLCRRLLTLNIRTHGFWHSTTARLLNELGKISQMQNQEEEAELMYVLTSEIMAHCFPDGHPDMGNVQSNLSYLYKASGRLQFAEAKLQQAVSIYDKHYGSKHPILADCFVDLALLFKFNGREDAASDYLEKALDVYSSAFGDTHRCVQNTSKLLSLFGAESAQTGERCAAAFDLASQCTYVRHLRLRPDKSIAVMGSKLLSAQKMGPTVTYPPADSGIFTSSSPPDAFLTFLDCFQNQPRYTSLMVTDSAPLSSISARFLHQYQSGTGDSRESKHPKRLSQEVGHSSLELDATLMFSTTSLLNAFEMGRKLQSVDILIIGASSQPTRLSHNAILRWFSKSRNEIPSNVPETTYQSSAFRASKTLQSFDTPIFIDVRIDSASTLQSLSAIEDDFSQSTSAERASFFNHWNSNSKSDEQSSAERPTDEHQDGIDCLRKAKERLAKHMISPSHSFTQFQLRERIHHNVILLVTTGNEIELENGEDPNSFHSVFGQHLWKVAQRNLIDFVFPNLIIVITDSEKADEADIKSSESVAKAILAEETVRIIVDHLRSQSRYPESAMSVIDWPVVTLRHKEDSSSNNVDNVAECQLMQAMRRIGKFNGDFELLSILPVSAHAKEDEMLSNAPIVKSKLASKARPRMQSARLPFNKAKFATKSLTKSDILSCLFATDIGEDAVLEYADLFGLYFPNAGDLSLPSSTITASVLEQMGVRAQHIQSILSAVGDAKREQSFKEEEQEADDAMDSVLKQIKEDYNDTTVYQQILNEGLRARKLEGNELVEAVQNIISGVDPSIGDIFSPRNGKIVDEIDLDDYEDLGVEKSTTDGTKEHKTAPRTTKMPLNLAFLDFTTRHTQPSDWIEFKNDVMID